MNAHHYTVGDFQVVQNWKRITLAIDQADADFLNKQTAHIQAGYGSHIAQLAWKVLDHHRTATGRTRSVVELIQVLDQLTGRMLFFNTWEPGEHNVAAEMQDHDFHSVMQAAEILNITPVQLMSAALTRRASQLREYQRTHRAPVPA